MKINKAILAITAIVKRGNKYLLVKRSNHEKYYKEHWQFPEGHVEPNEPPEKALKRELGRK